MTVRVLTISEALQQFSTFDAVLDARSPSEFQLDRLPGAVNWPVLNDEERHVVGTEYKQIAAFEARKRGAAMVARNIAQLLDTHSASLPKTWTPLVYCWRGGQRSGTLAWFLGQIGFRPHLIQGGYKAFRAHVRAELDTLPGSLSWVVIGGRTGSGKSRLLQALSRQGAQVLDLEALACHRGSVLGALPGCAQPSQKHFETQVWHALRRFAPNRPVFVESESRKIGALQVPEALIHDMRSRGRMVMVEMPLEARVALLLEDYAHFGATPDQTRHFCNLLASLMELQGRERVERWQAAARAGEWSAVFEALVREHYDPLYGRSMRQNYQGLDQALPCVLSDGSTKALDLAAQSLLAQMAAEPAPPSGT